MSTVLKWGLITGAVYIIFSLVSNLLGIQQGGGGSWALGMVVNILMMLATFFTIYLGVKEMRDEDLGGYLTMGQGFMGGLKMALIAGVIAGLFTFIYMSFIDPDMGARIMEGAESQWDEMNVPEEQREMGRKMTGIMTNPAVMAPFMIVYIAFWGLIKGLVAGAMLKKLPPMATPPTPQP